MHRLSMSKMNLAIHCAYGFRLDVESTERPPGDMARRGSAAHALVEDWYWEREPRDLTSFSLEAVLTGEAKRIATQMIKWLEPKRARILHCEIGLRYDAENDRAAIGPKRGEPGYDDVGAMVLPGTLDLALRGEDGVLEVIDIKTGKAKYVNDEQVDVQGLALARHLRETSVRVGFIYPRLTKCDEPEMRALDENALDVHAGIVHGLLRHLPMAEPQPGIGAGGWCWKCDARPNCPEFRETRDSDSVRELESAGFFS